VSDSSLKLRIIELLRPHWKALTLALVAVLGEALTDILEPWPLKIVVDNIQSSNKLPGRLGEVVTGLFGQDHYAVLYFAVAAVALIAIVGAVSSYFEKYLTTSVSQWVGHDLRRTLYHHINRLSLAEHDEARTGDLITRVTSDIGGVQDFITSALLGILVSVMTLVGMIGVRADNRNLRCQSSELQACAWKFSETSEEGITDLRSQDIGQGDARYSSGAGKGRHRDQSHRFGRRPRAVHRAEVERHATAYAHNHPRSAPGLRG